MATKFYKNNSSGYSGYLWLPVVTVTTGGSAKLWLQRLQTLKGSVTATTALHSKKRNTKIWSSGYM